MVLFLSLPDPMPIPSRSKANPAHYTSTLTVIQAGGLIILHPYPIHQAEHFEEIGQVW
jgi:hypothetical protein